MTAKELIERCRSDERTAQLHIGAFVERAGDLRFHAMPQALSHAVDRHAKGFAGHSARLGQCGLLAVRRFAGEQRLHLLKKRRAFLRLACAL